MVYAQIKDGIVKNVIVLHDVNLISLFTIGYDQLVLIDAVSPKPGPSWTYDGNNFSAPVQISIDNADGLLHTATTYNATINDFRGNKVITLSSSLSRSVVLPNPNVTPQYKILWIKDIAGTSLLFNISATTFGSESIDGQSGTVTIIASNWGQAGIFTNGIDWFTL